MKLPVIAGKNIILVVCNRLSKMIYFITTIEETLAEELTRLFRDNIWKLHKLPESIVLDKELQFVAEMINRMLGIETRLFIVYHLQIDK